MKQPTMVYRHPGPHDIHGDKFDYKIVEGHVEEGEERAELHDALDDNWFRTTAEAKAGAHNDGRPATRGELEEKAKELGIKFTKSTGDDKLLADIEAKLAEAGE